ncbi:kinase-like protein [Serendipita vermifera]|nr:kinase-like protein [Serendipita vermifera]
MSAISSLTLDTIDQIDEQIPELSGKIKLLDGPPVRGNYSDVYRGVLKGQIVAVKVLKICGSLAGMRRKVKRERIAWAMLRHPNILPLMGYIENDPHFGNFGVLVSPWCANGDSGRWLDQEGHLLPLDRRVSLWYEVAEAIEYLHTFKPVLIHGDLKPGNVLLDDNGHAMLCDFGLVRVIAEGETLGLTTTTEHTGTDRYAAPEFVTSEETIVPTAASDVYALGCLGLKFLFLKDPYSHRPNNLFGRIFNDIRSGMPPATKPVPMDEKQEFLWTLLESCWKPIPEERITAGQVLFHLKQAGWNRHIPTPVNVPGSIVRRVYANMNSSSFGSSESSSLPGSQIALASDFAPHQLESARAILKFLSEHYGPKNIDIPMGLITPELMETQQVYAWCLIGTCGMHRAKQTSEPFYNPDADFKYRKPFKQACEHVLYIHFLPRTCKIW